MFFSNWITFGEQQWEPGGIWYRSVPLMTSSSTSQYNASQPAGTQCPTAHHSCLTGRKTRPCPTLRGAQTPAIIIDRVSWELNSIHILISSKRAELSVPMHNFVVSKLYGFIWFDYWNGAFRSAGSQSVLLKMLIFYISDLNHFALGPLFQRWFVFLSFPLCGCDDYPCL